jgi:DNA-binding transcriptional LysR family regulator
MEIDQIRYFLAICDKGNFTRAAQTCGIKQPSLTAAIQRLEHSIGGKLFDRSSSPPVRLTKLGSQLLPIWKEINVLFEKTVALANTHFVQRGPSRTGARQGS